MTARTNLRMSIALALIALAVATAPYRAVAIGAVLPPSVTNLFAADPEPMAAVSTTAAPAPSYPAPQWAVQIGAFASSDAALAELEAYAQRESDLVGGAGRVVAPTVLQDGRIGYRARFGPFTEPQARALCDDLKQRGSVCFVADQAASDRDDHLQNAALSAAPAPERSKTTTLAQLTPVGADELSGARGGFFTAEGAEFDFGATVQTLVNGQLALQSTIQWGPGGPVVQQLAGSVPYSAPLSDTEIADIIGNAIASIAASGIRINSPTGITQVIANVTSTQVQNLLVNAASNQNITQNTDLILTIHNFSDWQQQIAQSMTAWRLANEVAAASSLSHGP